MKPELYEVWGDTVDVRHLVYAILIGAIVSLSAFFTAQHFLLEWVASAQMARAYAMLVGIVGCLVGGAISASLFKPKRHVVEHEADPAWRSQILKDLQSEFGDLGRLADLPSETIAELKEMDLYELFVDYEKGLHNAGEDPAPAVDGLAANGGRS
ncbi:hypothetical protein [Pseudomonas helleri]|uniref:hypothetical protein n=1 Tax=Pseudomonas helleri TaxID=1608996 RepID=UPI0028ED7F80|nr:hypothetical protein [Pseudomonas helleri]